MWEHAAANPPCVFFPSLLISPWSPIPPSCCVCWILKVLLAEGSRILESVGAVPSVNRLPLCASAASLLKGLKHANIVLLHDIIHTKETLTLVFEYVVRFFYHYWFFFCMCVLPDRLSDRKLGLFVWCLFIGGNLSCAAGSLISSLAAVQLWTLCRREDQCNLRLTTFILSSVNIIIPFFFFCLDKVHDKRLTWCEDFFLFFSFFLFFLFFYMYLIYTFNIM